MKIFNVLIVVIVLLSACSLERSNPLDPKGNPNVTTPAEVVWIDLKSANNFVEAQWRRVNDVGSYYLYRSSTWNGVYDRIAEIPQPVNPNVPVVHTDQNMLLPGYTYFYKISAVSVVPMGAEVGLEGPLSRERDIRVASGN